MGSVFIEEDKNILNAMRQLDKSARKILFAHREGKLLASLTDENIRRGIQKKGDLQVPIKYADNYQLSAVPSCNCDGLQYFLNYKSAIGHSFLLPIALHNSDTMSIVL